MEHRCSARVAMTAPVMIRDALTGWSVGRLVDIGQGGALVETNTALLTMNAPIVFMVKHRDETVRCSGMTVRIDETRAAIMFLDDNVAPRALRRLVERGPWEKGMGSPGQAVPLPWARVPALDRQAHIV